MNADAMKNLDPTEIHLHRFGHGMPLVLLHSLGMDHHFWGCLHPLRDRYEMVTYDLPGHGATPAPAHGYTIAELSEQLHGILEWAGIARAHVMGVSLGGMIAQHFAATWPDRVDRLVLADTAASFSRAARNEWQARAAAVRKHGPASLLPMIESSWFTPDFAARTPPEPEIQLVRESFHACSAEGYAQACEALAAADLTPLAGRIKAPTLVLCGREANPVFRDAAHWLGGHIEGSSVEFVEDAAHASLLQQSEPVAARLRSFLG